MIISLQKDQAGNILPFKTKDYKYIPLTPGSPMGMKRYSEYQKISTLVGLDFSFEGMLKAFEHIETTITDDRPFQEVRREILLYCNSIRQKVIDTGSSRTEKAFIMATLFFYREGENPNDWSAEWAEDVVTDWKEAGVSEEDILFFCLARIRGLNAALNVIQKEQQQEAERLSGTFG
jgi:hypothetical protein